MTLMKKILLPILLLLCTVANAGDGARRVVIIGDSITDGNWGCIYNYKRTSAERSSTDMNHIYGHSYVLFIATHYQSRKPEREYQFFNRGFSGNKLCDLAARWQEDVLDLHPSDSGGAPADGETVDQEGREAIGVSLRNRFQPSGGRRDG